MAYGSMADVKKGLAAEAVDHLRAAAGEIIMASPDFQRLLKDVGARHRGCPVARRGGNSSTPVAK
jgi:NTE family protein